MYEENKIALKYLELYVKKELYMKMIYLMIILYFQIKRNEDSKHNATLETTTSK